ncbi:GDSL-type esterase/lipase family protein [Arcobacter porcinus]|uniref:GDSL-like Lipase/Acylhydrolase n=1 Tax=Arcobacter porcinus TaxID=1935204 RepID=A0A1C0AY43_9BACT|nr:GDSL-type esterase/lipase family protein [Arcobacter porcinus]OCL94521.1 GDSL-like Lipase/Acylhydrolase [Aliarcobacter thereius]OCL83120.1 GDSL-like Lipase/Acylhydrolase [Arcobacter porcinus]OCL88161.1 GDSL-like Lipase/Acylhydrolase [Arcobacter porcinus]OCL92554.1 GDSL-like Lipase/Acylhydrolase [Arcobacter porcinus]QEP41487.1 sialate O-acetylesterase-like protein [Arcobacter porcinus]
MKLLSILLFFAIYTYSNEWTIQNDPYYKHKVSQFFMLKDTNISKIMMLGDSITDEGEWSELWGEVVQNRGISGDTTLGILDRVHTISSNIEEVYIMIGVNDIMRGSNAKEVFKNYKEIVKYFLNKKIKVNIQSTLYIGESRKSNFNNEIEILNRYLEDFAKSKDINFIDLNTILSENKILNSQYTKDDLHLNGEAYQLWINFLKENRR